MIHLLKAAVRRLSSFARAEEDNNRLPQHLRTGLWGERQAAMYLRKKGYKILEKRVRSGRRGELDIVCRTGQSLVFVEVKTRRSEAFGRPVSSVTPRKKIALSKAAIVYMKRLKDKPPLFRFDVIEVIGQRGDSNPEIRHIQNAFELSGKYSIPW
ncbi:MAG: YraN family protein [Verrucomicrobia bacterium]|nr:YraN family protein [Verrucomicrobiota bacterium]